ncbi:hypothetical protein EJB05_30486, partial [Eragrostis curvula]
MEEDIHHQQVVPEEIVHDIVLPEHEVNADQNMHLEDDIAGAVVLGIQAANGDDDIHAHLNNGAQQVHHGEDFLELNDLIGEEGMEEDESHISFQVSDSIQAGMSAGSMSSVNGPAGAVMDNFEDNHQVVLGLEAVEANQAPFIPTEVQMEELLNVPMQQVVQGPNHENDNNLDLNIQVGMVQIREELPADPVFEAFYSSPKKNISGKLNANCYRYWAKHFSMIGSNDDPQIQIPKEWVSFILSLLMSPMEYDWAKSLLISKAWEIIRKHSEEDEGLLFSVPSKCPVSKEIGCQVQEVSDETEDIGVDDPGMNTPDTQLNKLNVCSSASLLKEKYGCSEAIVESELRRSDRIKSYKNGFKHNTCENRNYFACTSEAPSLSPSIIKNLGTEFCNLSPDKVNDAALKKKRKAKSAIGQKEMEKKEDKKTEVKKSKKPKVSAKKIKKKSPNEDQDPKKK